MRSHALRSVVLALFALVFLRAPWMIRLMNPVFKPYLRTGLPGGPNVLLTVRGRTSGRLRSVPVAYLELGGRQFVQASYGETNWVRNLRASGEAILTKGRVRTTVSAFELSPETAESLACEDRDAIVGCPALADIAPQSGKLAFAICRTAVQMRPGQQGALGRRHRDSSLSTKGPGKAPKGVAAADRSG